MASVDEDKPKNRFNDAKCDKKGRLWCGTMPIEETKGVFAAKQGNLHSYDGGRDPKLNAFYHRSR